jgi:serine/threonine protein kinase
MEKRSGYNGAVALKAGDVVDRYRIVETIGAGGMGEVYRAFDMHLHRNVALKLVHPEADAGTAGASGVSLGTARMLREARAAAQLEHPNVVQVFDMGQLEEPEALRGTAFLSMELVQGRSLRELAKTDVPMDERLRWITDVARALVAAHAAGLIHRDVKPENVMLRDDGVVKVLDFGIAKRAATVHVDPAMATERTRPISTITSEGVAVGTPYYMSPEQMRGDPLDGRADQFSWAVMAYEVLVGEGPWRADTDALGLVSQILSRPAPSSREKNPDIPVHVEQILQRALAKQREDRFPSMDAVLAALQPMTTAPLRAVVASTAARSDSAPFVAQQVSVVATPAGVERAARPRAVWGLAGLAIVAVVLAVAAGVLRSPAPPISATPTPSAELPSFTEPLATTPESTHAAPSAEPVATKPPPRRPQPVATKPSATPSRAPTPHPSKNPIFFPDTP